MAPTFHYVIDCVSANAPFIHHIVDNNRAEDVGRPRREQPVTYATFRRNCDLSPWKGEIDFAHDWAISYHKSVAPSGVPIFYFRWSGIEHVFWPDGEPFDLERETQEALVAADLDDAAWDEISRHRKAAGTAWHFDGLGGEDESESISDYAGFNYAMVSPEGRVYLLDGDSHPDWCDKHRDLFGFTGGFNSDYEPDPEGAHDRDGNIALDYAYREGWIRVRPGAGISTDWIEGRVDLIKRLMRRMAKHHAGRTMYIDTGDSPLHVPVSPTGRPDFSEVDAAFPNG